MAMNVPRFQGFPFNSLPTDRKVNNLTKNEFSCWVKDPRMHKDVSCKKGHHQWASHTFQTDIQCGGSGGINITIQRKIIQTTYSYAHKMFIFSFLFSTSLDFLFGEKKCFVAAEAK